MKIFSAPDSDRPQSTKGAKGKKHLGPKAHSKETPVEKKAISDNEIREKLAAHVETSNTAKSKELMQNSQKFGTGFMNPDAKPVPVVAKEIEKEKEEAEVDEEKSSDAHLLKTDVNLNDPKDPTTSEKLKSIISKGAFNFNPREREALDKILNSN